MPAKKDEDVINITRTNDDDTVEMRFTVSDVVVRVDGNVDEAAKRRIMRSLEGECGRACEKSFKLLCDDARSREWRRREEELSQGATA